MSGTVQMVCGTTLLIAVLGAITALALQGTITGAVAMVTITAIVGIAGGALAVHSGVNAGANAATPVAPTLEGK